MNRIITIRVKTEIEYSVVINNADHNSHAEEIAYDYLRNLTACDNENLYSPELPSTLINSKRLNFSALVLSNNPLGNK